MFAEIFLDEPDVLGITAVRGTGDGELLIAPVESIETARAQEREYLEGLGAGSPEGERIRIAGGAEELVTFSNDGGVYSMHGFDSVSARNCYIEFVRLQGHNLK